MGEEGLEKRPWRVKNNDFGQLATWLSTLKFGWAVRKILLAMKNYLMHFEKQPLRNRFLHDLDYCLMVGQEGQPLWKVVGHLVILHPSLRKFGAWYISCRNIDLRVWSWW